MNLKKALSLVIILCLIFISSISTISVFAQNKKVVRVGFPIQNGLTEKTANGEYTGYTVSYLKELAKYTNWTYEFVEVDGDINTQLITLLDMLESGKIDMMGAMNYSETLEEHYLYPSYNYGTSYLTIAVKENSTKWLDKDYENWNGMKIALYPGFSKNTQLLEKFAEVTGFKYETIEYDSHQACVDAVLANEADATLSVDINMPQGLKGIAKFSPSPYYFALNKQRTDLLHELNNGMYSLSQSYPYIETELYNKYFTWTGNFYISKENLDYIKSLGTLKILFFKGNSPIQSGDKNGPSGIAETYIRGFAEKTGLQYEPVIAEDYEDGLDKILKGQVDLVAAVPLEATLMEECQLRLTSPYFKSYSVVVSSKDVEEVDYSKAQLLSANIEKELKLMSKESGLSMILDTYSVNYYLKKKNLYNNLNYNWSGNNESISYSVAVTKDIDNRLITILNTYSSSIDSDAKQAMLFENSQENPTYTIPEFIYAYKTRFLLIDVILGISISSLVLYRKNRSLKAVKDESEHFYQFTQLIDECLFEYDYKQDFFKIQNNKFIFVNKNEITKFFSYKFDDKQQQKYYAEIKDMLSNRIPKKEIDGNVNGKNRWYRVDIRYIKENRLDYAVGRITDVNEYIHSNQQLELKANTDNLTGLLNRGALENRLEKFVDNGGWEGVMILIDIDNFKMLNDNHGHIAGDKLLKDFAQCITNCFRENDWKVRLGGDEFVVFIPNYITKDLLKTKLQDLIEVVKNEVFYEYSDIPLSLSIGACYMSTALSTYQSMYRAADEAMYLAKHNGKGQVRIHDDRECERKICVNCKVVCSRKENMIKHNLTLNSPNNIKSTKLKK